jgi:hypothetical protein
MILKSDNFSTETLTQTMSKFWLKYTVNQKSKIWFGNTNALWSKFQL